MESPAFKGDDVESYILETARQRDLQECWAGLTKRLANYGFDRVLYGSREEGSLETIKNHAFSVVMSSYGAALDETFLDGRLYLNSPTVRWAFENEGAISWGVTSERAHAGELSEKEETVFHITQELGLKAGYSYSMPDRGNGTRSCFGLCYRGGGTQQDADDAWILRGGVIIQLLHIFEIAVSRFQHVPQGQRLSQNTLSVLKLAGQGRTIAEIAELQGYHRRTIEDHLTRARTTLGAANTLQAVLIARMQGQF